ncbi:hypothetical protein J437_LFUL012886 [Ladona fulva]|uniref:NHR domain-containing protein n=1 Tax=Ladona fulva TaxID=123851 RepID=A0A8K0P3Q4_LADFU|nr:hypothetical protein J437_LFUL012886 [Ladona fulva]
MLLSGVVSKSLHYEFAPLTSDVKMRAMEFWTLLVLFGLSILDSGTADVSDGVCLAGESDYEEGSLVIRLVRDKAGIWTTSVVTNDLLDDSINGTAVDINRKLFECNGQEVAIIKAVIAVPKKIKKYQLKFYPSGAKNVIVSKDGLTATRIDIEDEGNAGVLTDNPLDNEQLFEVKLDKVIDLYTSSIGIGISRFTPESSPYPHWMSSGTIMLYNNQVFEEEVIIKQLYATNLRALKVGDRIGVMVKRNGELHFFINGEDQGIAKTGVKYEVHGVIDLYANAVQASIV